MRRFWLIPIVVLFHPGCTSSSRPVTLCAVPSPPAERAVQLNPTWEQLDENGVPLSPRWMVQSSEGTEPLCLPDPDAEDVCGKFPKSGGVPQGKPACNDLAVPEAPAGDLVHGVVCSLGRGRGYFAGHLNYVPATYHGLLWFQNHAFPDDDIDWDMLPLVREEGAWKLRRPGLTTQRRIEEGLIGDDELESELRTKGLDYVLHVEAKASESVDRFGHGWWAEFGTASKQERRDMVRGRPAVVTGLLGLDAEHGAFTELHPAHAVAVQTECATPDPAAEGAYLDTWVFFVRNSGNEGWCSEWDVQHMFDFPSRTFTLALPAAFSGNMESAQIVAAESTVLADRAGVKRSPLVLDAGRLVMRLRWPEGIERDEHLRVHGVLQVRWRPRPGTEPQCLSLARVVQDSPADPVAAGAPPAPEGEEKNAEALLRQIYGPRPAEPELEARVVVDREPVEEAEVPVIDLPDGQGPCPGNAGTCGARLRAVVVDRPVAPLPLEGLDLQREKETDELCQLAESPDLERQPGVDPESLSALREACRGRD